MAQKSDLDWQSEKGYSLKLENLQTGSDFEQPLIPPNCKSGKKICAKLTNSNLQMHKKQYINLHCVIL